MRTEPAPGTLAARFDPRDNGLNLLRLLLASSVIVWHAFSVSGKQMPFHLGEGRMSDLGVDGFFGLSGFLIARSWLQTPRLRGFALRRALRILPGFYVCIVITAFVFAPLNWLHVNGSLDGFLDERPWRFVTENLWLRMQEYGVAGGPEQVPYAGQWGSALWTLYWEAACYGAVAVLGLAGLLTRRSPVLWGMLVLFAAVQARPSVGYGSFELGPLVYDGAIVPRVGLMFVIGVLLHLHADRVVLSNRLAALAAVVFLVALATPHYRAFGAVPYVYLLLWLAVTMPPSVRRIGSRTDISYGMYIYGFQVQQLLATFGVATAIAVWPLAVLSILATVPLGLASWHLVERRAMRLARREPSRGAAGPAVSSAAA